MYVQVLNSLSVSSLELLDVPADRVLSLEEFTRELLRVCNIGHKTEDFYSGVAELHGLLSAPVTLRTFLSFVAAQPEVTLPRDTFGTAMPSSVADEGYVCNRLFTDAFRHGHGGVRRLRATPRGPHGAEMMAIDEASECVDFFVASRGLLSKVCTLDAGESQSVRVKARPRRTELSVVSSDFAMDVLTSGSRKSGNQDGAHVVQGAVFAACPSIFRWRLGVLTANKWLVVYEMGNKVEEQFVEVGRFELRRLTPEVTKEERLTDVHYIEGRELFVTTSDSGKLVFWSLFHSSTKSELTPVRVAKNGHKDIVTDLVEVGDRMFVTASLDRSLVIWDSRGFIVDHVLRDHQASVLQLVHIPEPHNLLISVACSNKPLVWGLSTRFFRGLLKQLEGHKRNLTRVTANHTFFATLDEGGSVRVWRAKDLGCLCVLEHEAPVTAMLFMHGRLFVGKNKIYVYDPTEKTQGLLDIRQGNTSTTQFNDGHSGSALPLIKAGVHSGVCYSATEDGLFQHDRHSGAPRLLHRSREGPLADVLELQQRSQVALVFASQDRLVFLDVRSGVVNRDASKIVNSKFSCWALAGPGLLVAGVNGHVVYMNSEGTAERSFKLPDGHSPVALALASGLLFVGTRGGAVLAYKTQPWKLADLVLLEAREPIEKIFPLDEFVCVMDASGRRYELEFQEQIDRVKISVRELVKEKGTETDSPIVLQGSSACLRGTARWGLGAGVDYVAPEEVVHARNLLQEQGKSLASFFGEEVKADDTGTQGNVTFFVTEKAGTEAVEEITEIDEDLRSATPLQYVPRHTVEVYPPLYLNSKLPPTMQAREGLVVDFAKKRSDFLRHRPEDFGMDLDREGKKLWTAAGDLQSFAQAAAERVKKLASLTHQKKT